MSLSSSQSREIIMPLRRELQEVPSEDKDEEYTQLSPSEFTDGLEQPEISARRSAAAAFGRLQIGSVILPLEMVGAGEGLIAGRGYYYRSLWR